MKDSLVNHIDVDEDNEPSYVTGLSNDAVPNTVPTTQHFDSLSRRNSRTNESHSQSNDQADRTTGTPSNVLNFVDLNDIESAPPSLSRQEPVAAPRVTFTRARRRMIVDVDEFMDIDNKEDFSNSADDLIPSALSNPKRSASQNAAIKAVLGHDDFDDGEGDEPKKLDEKLSGVCSDSVAGYTVDLSEDEIAATVPPDLQRQSGGHISTPGAFAVPGRGDVAAPIASSRARASMRRSRTELDEHCDGVHMISATLVGNGDMSHDAPMLVYAERLWWKRRFVLCLSVWILLVIAVISVSVTLTIRFSMSSSDENNEENTSLESKGGASSFIVTNFPTAATPTKSPSKPPIDMSPSPASITDPPGTMISMYSASWGVLTNCSEFNSKVQSYEMIISCTGKITLEKYDNVDCRKFRGSNNAFYPGKLSCRLNSSKPYNDTSTNVVYQQATGLALFSCRGTLEQDLLAGAELFNVTVSNCSPSSSTLGAAATFVSMGRFCQDGSSLQFRDVFSDCGSSDKCIVLAPSLPVCSFDTDDNSRKLNFFSDIKDAVDKFGDEVITFCYESTSCSNQNATSDVCTLNVPEVTSENIAAAVDVCSNPGYDEANVDNMWNTAQSILDPLKRIEVIVGDVF